MNKYYKEKENKTGIISIQQKKKHKYIALIVTLLFIILWISLIYIARNILLVNNYVIMLFIIPIIVMIYHLRIINKSLDKSKTYEKERKMIMHIIKKEHDFAKLIPVAVFGFSLLYGSINSNILRIVCPFLLFSITFGTIIPFFVAFLNVRDSSIEKLIASEVLQFCSETVAFVNLIPVVFLPFLYLNKTKNNNKFSKSIKF